MKLGEVADVQPLAAQIELYDDIREALRQALNETLARLASRESLDAMLAQAVSLRAAAPRPALRLPAPRASYEMLTVREREILKCIALGHSNKAIARTFDLSVHTVKRHVANILGKLGVSSRIEAATWMSARH
jgi:DNA-binding NarL/FixJ family response regulator